MRDKRLPVEGFCDLYCVPYVFDDFLSVRLVRLWITNEHANAELPVLDQEGTSPIVDWHRPRYLFKLTQVLETQQIHQNKIDEVIGRQIATRLRTLRIKQEIFVGGRGFADGEHWTKSTFRGITNTLQLGGKLFRHLIISPRPPRRRRISCRNLLWS
jgi:hypothetical protein